MLRARVFKRILVSGILLAFATIFQSQVSTAAEGNPDIGNALFAGKTAFANGGAPCMGCHALGGIGAAGAANFGPDLSSLYEENQDDGVTEILQALVDFPSMKAIYTDRPLTEEEQLHLTTFFKHISEQQAGTAGGSLGAKVWLGGLFLIILFGGGVALIGWRRLNGVRRPLVEQAKKQRGEI